MCIVHCAVCNYQAIYDEVSRAVEEGEIAHTEVSQPLEVKGGQKRSGEITGKRSRHIRGGQGDQGISENIGRSGEGGQRWS